MTQEDFELLGWLMASTFIVWCIVMAFVTDDEKETTTTKTEDHESTK